MKKETTPAASPKETPTRAKTLKPSASGLPAGMRTQETEALVERAQAGDAAALNDLFTQYYSYMVDLARRRLGSRLRVKEEADDLAQTTFREATRDFGQYQYRGEGSLLRWLGQILHNKIRDKAEYYSAGKRDMSRERPVEDAKDESGAAASRFESPDLTVTRQVQRKEEFVILREALEDLSPDHRKAITLVFFQGLPLREAGKRMDGRSEDAERLIVTSTAEVTFYEAPLRAARCSSRPSTRCARSRRR